MNYDSSVHYVRLSIYLKNLKLSITVYQCRLRTLYGRNICSHWITKKSHSTLRLFSWSDPENKNLKNKQIYIYIYIHIIYIIYFVLH